MHEERSKKTSWGFRDGLNEKQNIILNYHSLYHNTFWAVNFRENEG